jgi:hypothetical protein
MAPIRTPTTRTEVRSQPKPKPTLPRSAKPKAIEQALLKLKRDQFIAKERPAVTAHGARLLGQALGQAPTTAGVKALKTSASSEAQDKAKELIEGSPVPNPNLLARYLRESTPEVQRELIRQVADSENAAQWLQGVELGADSRKGKLNEGYDDMKTVGDALNRAYREGDIDKNDLKAWAESWGPEGTASMVQSIGLSVGSSDGGGIVEALGEQAKSLGYDQAAALAFTSSDSLIDKHYPTADAQRAAFEEVKSYIDDSMSSSWEWAPEDRNAMGSALVNAARLTARGNGYTQEELDAKVDELGPELVGEAIAQAGERVFNGAGDGPLDVLGDAATRAAAKTDDGDDKKLWETAAATAYTQSPSLMQANLKTDEERMKAFETLNAYLAETRGEWSLAKNDGGYSLVRAPQAMEGLNRLLSAHPQLITQMLDAEPQAKGEANLVQLFESIALNPDVPASERDRLSKTINSHIEDQMSSASAGDANEAASRVGRILGTLQVAADRAVNDAEAPDDKVKELALGFASSLVGTAASAGLTATTGPVGAAIGNAILGQVLPEIFKTNPPAADEIQRAFTNKLKDAGINVSAGEAGHDLLKTTYLAMHDAITEQIEKTNNPADKAKLQEQLNVVQGVINGLSTFGDTHDSGEGGGELATELNARRDNP